MNIIEKEDLNSNDSLFVNYKYKKKIISSNNINNVIISNEKNDNNKTILIDETLKINSKSNSLNIIKVVLHPTIYRYARGSDNWATTWASDDFQYSVWGDGWGFKNINTQLPKPSIGIARLAGSAESFSENNVIDVFEGDEQGSDKEFDAKSWGIIALDSILYMWKSPSFGSQAGNGGIFTEARLNKSVNYGISWKPLDWAFIQSDNLILPSIMQAGKNYSDSEDNYLYMYAPRYTGTSHLEIQVPGKIDLFRVEKSNIEFRSSYEFFGGFRDTEPIWTTDVLLRKPIYEANTVCWAPPTVNYNKALDKYLMVVDYDAHPYTGHTTKGHWAILQADKPWGPWGIVEEYFEDWTGFDSNLFYFNFAPKWTSIDGKTMWLIATGSRSNSDDNPDAFLLRKVTLEISESKPIIKIKKPDEYTLQQNFPNPFNPETTINFQIKDDGFASLKVYNIVGEEISVLINENKIAGFYTVDFDASNLPSGVYIYRLSVNNFVEIRKMIFSK